jgi:hypothetical protein
MCQCESDGFFFKIFNFFKRCVLKLKRFFFFFFFLKKKGKLKHYVLYIFDRNETMRFYIVGQSSVALSHEITNYITIYTVFLTHELHGNSFDPTT